MKLKTLEGFSEEALLKIRDISESSFNKVCDLEYMERAKLVEDSSDKFFVKDVDGHKLGVLDASSIIDPESAEKSANLADLARKALHDELAQCILVPHKMGWIAGRSCTVARFYSPIPNWPLRRFHYPWRARPVLDWLFQVTKSNATIPDPKTTLQVFRDPLVNLMIDDSFPETVRLKARQALGDLDDCAWLPRTCPAHYDIWFGNILLDPLADRKFKFKIIDWGASRLEGHPIHDLVQLALNANLSPADLKHELTRTAQVLQCMPKQTIHYLLAAIGFKGQHLGQWPKEQYIQASMAAYTKQITALT